MTAGVPQRERGVQMFLMPEAIVRNGSLKSLSGDALCLFIAVTHRMYRMRSADIKMSLRDLYSQIELGRSDIQKAAKELREAGLLYFQQSENLMMFQIQQPDGSKAKIYLHPPKQPAQDAYGAQTNIEVGPVSERLATSATHTTKRLLAERHLFSKVDEGRY